MNNSTDECILQVAERLFLEKGFSMTSTTDIAREVGCNQALVYYYFHSKENLINQIFMKKTRMILANCRQILESDAAFEDRISQVIASYFALLNRTPRLPFLIFSELMTNENRRGQVRDSIVSDPEVQRVYYTFKRELDQEIEAGRVRSIDLLDLLMNIMSLTVMTFMALPMYADFLLKTPDEQRVFLKMREKEVRETVLRSLRNV